MNAKAVALRNREFEDFQDFYENKNPLEAIEQYDFTYRYKVSPDKRTIYAFDRNHDAAFGYYRSNYTEFSPKMELCFDTEKGIYYYQPCEMEEGEMDVHVRIGQYVHTIDNRTIIIDAIIEDGKRYRGRDINIKELPEVELKHSDIIIVKDEI